MLNESSDVVLLFELYDMWQESQDASDYVLFLVALIVLAFEIVIRVLSAFFDLNEYVGGGARGRESPPTTAGIRCHHPASAITSTSVTFQPVPALVAVLAVGAPHTTTTTTLHALPGTFVR